MALIAELWEQPPNMSAQHIVFTFAGQGYPPVEAARDLYRTSQVFEDAIRKIQKTNDVLQQENAIKIGHHTRLTDYLEEEEIRPPYATSFDHIPQKGQKLLPPSESLIIVAAQFALGRMLQSWDIAPRSVMAYSLGEIVAGTFTGSYTLPAVMKLLARRESLLSDRSLIPEKGGLALIFTGGDGVKDVLAKEGLLGTVDIAGFSNPVTTCLAGDANALDIALQKFEKAGIGIKRVKLEVGMVR
jgi:acyl transferase domain-containing protein